MGRPGRPPIAIFNEDIQNKLNETATEAGNRGAYTVESLCPGIVYMIYNDRVSIATNKGSMTIHISTAKMICEELVEILQEVATNKREGITPMNARQIGKMLERDYK